MAKHIDLTARVDEVTVSSAPRTWDPKIARAMLQRRRQQLAGRLPDRPASGTELIQARLAEARAREEAGTSATD